MKINLTKFAQYLRMLLMVFLIVRPQCIISAYPGSVMIFSIIHAAMTALFLFSQTKIVIHDPFIWSVILYYSYDLLNTVLQNSASPNVVFVGGIWVLFSIIAISRQISRYGFKDTVYKLSICFGLILWLNCILVVIFPNGLVSVLGGAGRFTRIFLLGQANQLSIFIVFEVILVVCNFYVQKKLSFMYLMFTLGSWPVSFVILGSSNRSMTGTIAGVLLILGYLLYKLLPFIVRKIANPIVSTILLIFLFLGLTRILALESVSHFIQDVLNKDVTLSERTTIWAQVYVTLSNVKALIFGMGEATGGAYITIWTGHTFSAHNIILQILCLGGLILLAIFIVPVVRAIKSIGSIRNDKAKAALSICLFIFFLMNMLEVYYYPMVFLTLYIFYQTGMCLSTSVEEQ